MWRSGFARPWIASAGLALAACSGDLIGPEDGGTVYDLAEVEGHTLPLTIIDQIVYTVDGQGRYRVLLHDAAILLKPDSQATVATETQLISATTDSTWVSRDPYRWMIVQDTLIQLCTDFDDPLIPVTCGFGQWRDGEFTLRGSAAFGVEPEFVFRFVRR